MNNYSERDLDQFAGILDHCDRIEEALVRLHFSKNEYDRDYLLQDAIKMNLFQIGELANKVSDEAKRKLSNIPWIQIIATRNIIAHAYQKVSEDILWDTCTKDVPVLRQILESSLES